MSEDQAKSTWTSQAILPVVIVGVTLWGTLLAINIALVVYQYRIGAGSSFLITLGVTPYLIPIIIDIAGAIMLRHRRNTVGAFLLALLVLALWVPVGALWLLGVGSS